MTSLDLLGQLSQHWDVDLNKSLIDTVISRPPFVRIDGTFNARYITSDLDNSANVHDPESVNPLSIKPGYIYRGAVLSYLTEEGKAKIRDLGIKTIFDLRSDKERERDPEPEVEGVESRWFPSTKDEITLPSAIAAASGSARFEDLYLHFLQTHKNVYRAVFEHIRDQPGIPFMFHCMGGKDRTGVLSALILYIAGTPIETMTLDYLLTRAGLEPAKHHLTKLIQQKNNGTDLNDPRVKAWADLPPDAMVKFISRAETEVEGGLDGYFRHQLGFSDQDLTKIRNTLRGSQGQL